MITFLCAFSISQILHAESLTPQAGALSKGTNQEISISFSAPVDGASAGDSANYSIPPGTIEEIRLVPLANAAILTVSGLIVSNSYTVSVSNITALDVNIGPITQTNLTVTTRDMTWAGIGRNETAIPQDVVAIGTNGFALVSGALTFFSSQDQFSYEEATFAYEMISGDFDRAVQVESQDVGSQWSRAGVMVREAVDEDKDRQSDPADPTQAFSRYQAVQVNPATQFDGTPANNLYEINRRLVPGGVTDEPEITNNVPPPYPKAWVRLARTGSTFRMYRSDTGTNWIKLGETTFDPTFATNAYVGVHFSPELANIPQDDPSYRQKLARFSHYGDPHAPADIKPTIKIEATQAGVQVTFAGNLQSASNVRGPWNPVATGSPYRVPNGSAGVQFFRATVQ